MPINHFNIRVYGIILNETNDAILISDEFQLGMCMTKFPGGGMHFGEGPIDCLKREAIEEFGQEIEIVRHFYTTDFFQKALFYEDHQLISIYYVAKFKETPCFKISSQAFDFDNEKKGGQSFRWVKISDINTEMFTFPIDKVVSEMIR
jgi:ADP-ribose pyrophosphatase YjhB (NUDIX family)